MGTNLFTDEQRQAIYTENKNILVAAAAGSGKTAVLVERIINLITNAKKPIDADKLVVVTFTRAAANEMRQKISKALLASLENDLTNEYLRKQVILLNKAHISTMDSFCLNILRKYFYLVDIDPSFKIVDPTEENLIKTEVLNNVFEDEYTDENNSIFFDIVESYGGSKTKDDGLTNLIFKIYNLISNIPWSKDWLSEKVEMFNIQNENFEETFWFATIKNQVLSTLSHVLKSVDYAIDISKGYGGPNQYLENLMDDYELVLCLIKSTDMGYEKMYDAFKDVNEKFTTLSRKKGEDVDPELKDIVYNIRNTEIKKSILKLKEENFIKPINGLVSDIKDLYPILKKLEDLIIKFSKEYKTEKFRRNLIDFSDAQHYCLEILVEKKIDDNGEIIYAPTKTALELSENFEQIMIDEYQDSNLIQELIFSSISKTGNRFMVGDIKQSIYRFRGANPDIFLEKYNLYENNENHKNLRVDLFKNFRSRKNVLESVNFFFYQLMNKEIGKIGYDEKVALYTGANFAVYDGNISSSTEVLLGVMDSKSDKEEYDREEYDTEELEEFSRLEMEAEIIALKINEMINGKDPINVLDKETNEYRPATFSDIVILMRSVTAGDTLVNIFKNHGIPLYLDLKSGYFESIEVSTILSFLQIIDNPRQDLHLIAILRSPIYMFNADELLEIRNIKQDCDFYGCVLVYLEKLEIDGSNTDLNTGSDIDLEISKKLNKFMKELNVWREKAIIMPISLLLSKLYDETNYFNYLGVMPAGALRQANLNALLEKAIAYEDTSLKGLFHFVKYIERLQKTDNTMEIAKISTEKENLVRLMTIHKSKGLEFPIVFVSMLGRKFNIEDKKEQILMHHKYGFGPSHVDLQERIKSKTIAKIALSHEIHKENRAEEMRMFYVALTRAKEKLILTGVTRDIASKINNWKRYFYMPQKEFDAYFLLKSTSYLEWICASLARHRDGGILRGEATPDNSCNDEIFNFPAEFEIKFLNTEDIKRIEAETNLEIDKLQEELKQIGNNKDYSGKTDEINEKFSFVYPFSRSTTLPTKISISEIKRLHQKELIDNYTEVNVYEKPIYSEPKFRQKNKDFTKAQIGTITHTVMEHLDFSKENNLKDLENLISILVEKNIISKEESHVVPIDKIINFAKSDLAKRMSKAKILKREVTFVMGLSPYEIYRDESLKENKDIILVHGILDCYFEEDGEIVIVDYKSDYIKNIDNLKEKYKIQLDIYKRAVEKSTDMKVKECVLYAFDIDREIRVL